jgi:sensor domain CHASE-containing protein
MTLRAKTLVVTALALAALFALLFGLVFVITTRSFGEVEQRTGFEQLDRIESSLRAEHEQLVGVAADWAPWDETYGFVQRPNKKYVEDNLSPEALANLRSDVFVFIDERGNVVYSRGVDIDSKKVEPVPAELIREIEQHPTEFTDAGGFEERHGLLMLDRGPLAFATHSITRSDFTGPPRGTLLVGRYLDAATDRYEERALELLQEQERWVYSLLRR